jgi:hypothetical protein
MVKKVYRNYETPFFPQLEKREKREREMLKK